MSIYSYLPQDRLWALAHRKSLPDRTCGSVLFADISGFTPLTEALRNSLGSRQGAEELTKHLDTVYTALIGEVEKYGGSVLGFSGDAITCWFAGRMADDGQSSAIYAMACAFGLQKAMEAFNAIALPNGKTTALTLKVSVATGDARRFVVGDPEIHYIDALAGATVARMAAGEHLADKGEILLDEATIEAVGDVLSVKEWRNTDNGEKFAVAEKLSAHSDLSARDNTDHHSLITPEQLKTWLHSAVYNREQSGQETFLTEFRPCTVLFINFAGIDYEAEDAENQLDAFIRQLQKIATRYEGALLQLTIGDKGSYAYINFGALTAHEDDSRRAVKAALEIKNKTELQLHIGISQGVMRVGAYGGETRKTFSALGDDVNLAARLMTNAKEHEILLSGHVHKTVINDFTFEPRPPLAMKGKAEPSPVFAVTGESQRRAVRLQEPNYSLPMVGRGDELKQIEEKLDLAKAGKSQVIGIVAEAGLGKSRLVAEVIRAARKKGFIGYGGACQSDAVHTPYHAWKSIWQAFFDVDPEMSEKRLIRWLEGEIEDRAPTRLEAMPLLNVVLDLDIPENDFTQDLEPKIRQSALHALLEDCLKAQAGDEPILIVIEDLHWIDALSHDLLEQLTRALANHAVCFILAYRPPQLERLQAPRIEALEQFTRIELRELTLSEAENAIRAKLAQLYPVRGGALPAGLVDKLMARAQGNPFYLEELLNYLHDRSIDPSQLDKIELPDSLHALILSRIDQLSEAEKTTLRAASIIGRLFHAGWLTGYYPELGAFPTVKASLDTLEALEITPLDSEPELAYLFKHIVTHEVTYENLPFATRAKLHEQLAQYLESVVGATHESPLLDTIAYHYLRSDNKSKQREYLRKAGEAAQKNFAHDAALNYYRSLLPLLTDDREKSQIYLKCGQVLQWMGEYDKAETEYLAALETAREELALKANAQFALGKLNLFRSEYVLAEEWLGQAISARAYLEDTAGLAQGLIDMGTVWLHKGDYSKASETLNKGMALAQKVGNKLNEAWALNNLGDIARAQNDYASARALFEESLAIRRKIGDKAGISASLNNLGVMAYNQGDYTTAQALYEESLTIDHEIGDKWGIATMLHNLGEVALSQGDYATARPLFEESLNMRRQMGFKRGIVMSLLNLGSLIWLQGNFVLGRALIEESLALSQEINEKLFMIYSLIALGFADIVEQKPTTRTHILHALQLQVEMGIQVGQGQVSGLVGAAGLALQEGNPLFAVQLLSAVETILKTFKTALLPGVPAFQAQTLSLAKESLGEEMFQSAWEDGARWTLEEAVKKVLGE